MSELPLAALISEHRLTGYHESGHAVAARHARRHQSPEYFKLDASGAHGEKFDWSAVNSGLDLGSSMPQMGHDLADPVTSVESNMMREYKCPRPKLAWSVSRSCALATRTRSPSEVT